MNYLITLIFCLIEALIMYILINKLIERHERPGIPELLLFLSTCISTILTDENSAFLSVILNSILYIFYIFYISRESISNCIINYALTFITIIFIQLMVVFLSSVFGFKKVSYTSQLLYNIETLILAYIIAKFSPIQKLYQMMVSSAMPVKLLLINSYLIFFSLLLTFKMNNSIVYINITYYLAIVSLIFAVNMGILYYDKSLYIKQQELQAYQKNLPIYETLIHEIRSNQHEYSNRIQALHNLTISCKNYESLSNALNCYTKNAGKTSSSYPLLHINMPLLAASLYSLCEAADMNDISVDFSIENNHLSSNAPEYVLSDFSYILLQNAIEASNSGDYIYAKIKTENSQFYIEVRNPVERYYSTAELSSFLKRGYTTKSAHKKSNGLPHGYGLYTLHRNLEKYNGHLGFECVEFENKYWIIFRMII